MNNYNWLKILLTYIFCFILQTTVADWLRIFDIGPDFVIIMVVSVALKYGPAAGCFWGFLAGFTQDVYAPVEWLGAHSVALTVLGFVVGQVEERILSLNLPAKVGVLAIGFCVSDLIYFVLTGLDWNVITALLVSKTLPECVYTVVVGTVVFRLSIGKKKRHV